MKMTATPFDLLFGCWHKNLSFPQTAKLGQRRPSAAFLTGTYVVCLDCGREFAYDWQTMHTVPRGKRTVRPDILKKQGQMAGDVTSKDGLQA